MQEGKSSKNHQKLPKVTSSLHDQDGFPNKHPKKATMVAPPHATRDGNESDLRRVKHHPHLSIRHPSSETDLMSKELDWMTSNIQDSILNSFESSPQSKARNKAPNRAPQNPCSKAPVGPFREHDLYMPIANVVRNMRRGLPLNTKVSDEAKEMVQECVSEFISFVTSEANEVCKTEHRKTIQAEDVIGAMTRLGFEDYVQPLKLYLRKYRESMMLPSVPKHGVMNKSTEASAVTPMTSLPPAIHPHSDKFRASVTSSESFGDGSGTSTGPITMGQGVDTGTIWDGSGPSLALGIGAEPGGNERGGPSGSTHAELEFNDFNDINE